MPLLKTIHTKGELLVVICDKELLGKRLKRGKLRLEVRESFYRGKEATVEECLVALREATIANLVGSIVEHAVKAGMIGQENVIRFQKVPHAQLVRL